MKTFITGRLDEISAILDEAKILTDKMKQMAPPAEGTVYLQHVARLSNRSAAQCNQLLGAMNSSPLEKNHDRFK